VAGFRAGHGGAAILKGAVFKKKTPHQNPWRFFKAAFITGWLKTSFLFAEVLKNFLTSYQIRPGFGKKPLGLICP
jgi:hypothetical protein